MATGTFQVLSQTRDVFQVSRDVTRGVGGCSGCSGGGCSGGGGGGVCVWGGGG